MRAIRSGHGTTVASALRTVTMRLVARAGPGWQGLLRAPDIDMVLALIAFVALLVDPLLLHKITGLTR